MRKPSLLVLACLVLAASALRAQAPEYNVRIYAVGGFLGYQEGLTDPEDLTKAKGGLFAVQDWLESGFVGDRDLLVLTGNNLSLDTANHAVGALGADAVAVSIDDFLRSLRPPDRAADFVHLLQQNDQPPFVASNAIVRIKKKGLNTIDGDGVDLEVGEDASIAWVSRLQAVCDDECPSVATAIVTESAPRAGAQPITAKVTRSRDLKHLSIALEPSLRPGHTYTLVLNDGQKALGTFTVTTHQALTRPRYAPRLDGPPSPPIPDVLRDLPIQYASRDLGASSRTAVIVLGMIDPDTRKLLGADRWRWSTDGQPRASCDGDECEIDFLPATDAFAAIKSQLDAVTGKDAPPALLVLVSGLDDTQTSSLLSTGDKGIRFVVLDPDASTIGREIGDEAIVNDKDRQRTQLWARPEWIGAQAEVLQAQMHWEDDAWQMKAKDVLVIDIKTTPFDHRVDSTRREVEYFVPATNSTPERKLTGPRPVYPATPPWPGAAAAPGALWVTKGGTAAIILDEVRRDLAADLALIRSHAIDEDIVNRLAASAKTASLDWMSRFMLEKLLYQMEHFVSVDVEGSKLATTLTAIVKTEKDSGETLYSAGLGLTGPVAAIDADHLEVNERRIMPTHFYRIALPQSVAEANKLTLAGGELPSILDRVDARLQRERASVLADPLLDTTLEEDFAGRPKVYLSIAPAHFEFHRASIDKADQLLLKNLPLAGRSVQAEEQWAASGFGDLGLDLPKWALRGTADLRYSKKTVDDATTNPYDEWTAGVRGDFKWESRFISRIFGGWFAQSWFRDHTDAIAKPSRTIASAVSGAGETLSGFTLSGQPVKAFVQRPLYKFWRGGVEFSSKAWPWLGFKDLRLAYDWGTAHRDRTDVKIGEERHAGGLTIADYFKSSTDFLNSWFTARPDLFTTSQTLLFDYAEPRRQRRVQTDGAVELTPPWPWLHAAKLTSTIQYRKYLAAEREAYTPDWTLDSQTKLEWTLFGRLKVGPFVNYYRVRAKGVDNIMKYRDWGIGVDFPIFFSPRRIPVLQ